MPVNIQVPDAVLSAKQTRQMLESLQPGDQIFQNQTHGLFNAGLMGRLLKSNPEMFERYEVPLDIELLEYVFKNIELNSEVISSMSNERLHEPVFMVTLADKEPHLLIDGHHRVAARGMHQQTYLRAYVADRKATEIINVVKW